MYVKKNVSDFRNLPVATTEEKRMRPPLDPLASVAILEAGLRSRHETRKGWCDFIQDKTVISVDDLPSHARVFSRVRLHRVMFSTGCG